MYLFDTNIYSELIKPVPDQRVRTFCSNIPPEQVYASAITVGEIQRGILLLPQGGKRSRLEIWYAERFLRNLQVLPVDQSVAEAWAEISSHRRIQGMTLNPLGGLIAATAFLYCLVLVTRNERDFRNTGIQILNPWLD